MPEAPTLSEPTLSEPMLAIAIPSYQRADELTTLLNSIDRAADALRKAERPLDGALEICIALDGSTDGSEEYLASRRSGVPVRWEWQPNRGRSAARNLALSMVHADSVWFLDDDIRITAETLASHLDFAREAGEPSADPGRLLAGPCWVTDDADSTEAMRQWLNESNERLVTAGVVTDPMDMLFANTSGPTEFFRSLGGFDESFQGWGAEDAEFAIRVAAAGATMIYSAEAAVDHVRDRPAYVDLLEYREAGRNRVQLLELHPDQLDAIFPPARSSGLIARIPVLGLNRTIASGIYTATRTALRAAHRVAGHRLFNEGWLKQRYERVALIGRQFALRLGTEDGGGSELMIRRTLGLPTEGSQG